MIEIIPNWHPVLVHFTIALFATSTGLFFAGGIFSGQSWSKTLLRVAHINLWIGAGITILTLLAGWDAYNTVTHDAPSHAAMTDHRNWAFVTAALFGVIAIWSLAGYRKTLRVGVPFLAVLAIASVLLATTGYKGGEAVYRYGLGVMSLPQAEGGGGHDSHSEGGESTGGHQESGSKEEAPHDDGGDH